jgi:hypothetical protein
MHYGDAFDLRCYRESIAADLREHRKVEGLIILRAARKHPAALSFFPYTKLSILLFAHENR